MFRRGTDDGAMGRREQASEMSSIRSDSCSTALDRHAELNAALTNVN